MTFHGLKWLGIDAIGVSYYVSHTCKSLRPHAFAQSVRDAHMTYYSVILGGETNCCQNDLEFYPDSQPA